MIARCRHEIGALEGPLEIPGDRLSTLDPFAVPEHIRRLARAEARIVGMDQSGRSAVLLKSG